MATHRAQGEKIPKGTRAVHTDTAEQRHFVETLVRDHDHQTSGQPLGPRATQVPSIVIIVIIPIYVTSTENDFQTRLPSETIYNIVVPSSPTVERTVQSQCVCTP